MNAIEIMTLVLIICLAIIAFVIFIDKNCEGVEIRKWKGIVVHHSGSNYDSFKSIDSYHKLKGWDCCGYHYVIERDGRIFEGRPLSKVGAHAKTCGPNRNKTHIGICLTGNEVFSFKQHLKLNELCQKLSNDFSIISIERHHEECPGSGIDVEKLEQETFKGI